jgi:ankyrin repeat protein
MKRFLRCVLLAGLFASTASALFAGSDQQADKPSEDTIRDFHIAVGAGDRRTVEKMIKVYPDLVSAPCPDDDANNQVPPVFTAIDHGQADVLGILLKNNSPRTNDRTRQTALYRATVFGNKAVVELLLNQGENIDGLTDAADQATIDDLTRGTPLRDAISNGHPEIAQLLVRRGARVDLFSAAGLGWTGWVTRQVKDHPEQVDIVDGWRYTPLCYAVAAGASGTAEVLLSHGADVTRTYDDGGTLLHLATYYGHHDLIGVLLAHGAEVNIKNKAGETALDYAIKYKQQDAAELLREHGGKRAVELGN